MQAKTCKPKTCKQKHVSQNMQAKHASQNKHRGRWWGGTRKKKSRKKRLPTCWHKQKDIAWGKSPKEWVWQKQLRILLNWLRTCVNSRLGPAKLNWNGCNWFQRLSNWLEGWRRNAKQKNTAGEFLSHGNFTVGILILNCYADCWFGYLLDIGSRDEPNSIQRGALTLRVGTEGCNSPIWAPTAHYKFFF